MKRIAAVESFFSPEHRAAIEKAAAECGFSVDYFTQGHLPADQAADYEIIYGMCPPQELKAARPTSSGFAAALPGWMPTRTRPSILTRMCC